MGSCAKESASCGQSGRALYSFCRVASGLSDSRGSNSDIMLEEHRQGLYITIIVIFVQCELTREDVRLPCPTRNCVPLAVGGA